MRNRVFKVQELGPRIRELRKAGGWDQSTFADELGVCESLISRWENSKDIPSAEVISLMAILFDVTADELLFGPSLETSAAS